MAKAAFACLAITLILLSGCANKAPKDEIVTLDKTTAQPCYLPDAEKGKYASPKMTPDAMVKIYSAGRARNINGCAGVAFQIDNKGKTTNVRIVKEAPQGSGFGDDLANAVRLAVFDKPKEAGKTYYVSTSHIMNPNAK
jgi:outer membrane biosynthesis protein TonB